jgi:hypothetical protein
MKIKTRNTNNKGGSVWDAIKMMIEKERFGFRYVHSPSIKAKWLHFFIIDLYKEHIIGTQIYNRIQINN